MASPRVLRRQISDILKELEFDMYTLSGVEQGQNVVADLGGLLADLRSVMEAEEEERP